MTKTTTIAAKSAKSVKSAKSAPSAGFGFGDFAVSAAPAAAKKTDKVYPIVPASDETTVIVDEFIRLHAEAKAIEGALTTVKAQLNAIAVVPFFDGNSGKAIPSSGVVAKGTGINEAMVTYTSRYGKLDQGSIATVSELIGASGLQSNFIVRPKVTLDFKTVDQAKHVELRARMIALFAEMGVSESVTDTLEAELKDTKSFHAGRHVAFDAETNVALHEVFPCVSQVKVRNSSTGEE